MKFGLSVTAFMFCSGGMMLVNKQVMLPVAERDTPSPSTAHPLLTPSRPAEPATPTHGLWLCGLEEPGLTPAPTLLGGAQRNVVSWSALALATVVSESTPSRRGFSHV